jgi:hypothetical protein
MYRWPAPRPFEEIAGIPGKKDKPAHHADNGVAPFDAP